MTINLISIKKISGRVKWEGDFPRSGSFNLANQFGYITLEAKNVSQKPYKAELILVYDHMEHTYVVEGLDRKKGG